MTFVESLFIVMRRRELALITDDWESKSMIIIVTIKSDTAMLYTVNYSFQFNFSFSKLWYSVVFSQKRILTWGILKRGGLRWLVSTATWEWLVLTFGGIIAPLPPVTHSLWWSCSTTLLLRPAVLGYFGQGGKKTGTPTTLERVWLKKYTLKYHHLCKKGWGG